MKRDSLALVTTIVFITLIALVSIALFTLMTSQIRFTSHQVDRAKAFYATESAMLETMEKLRLNQTATLPPNVNYTNIDWYAYSGALVPEGGNVTVEYNASDISGPYQSRPVEFIIEDYSR